MKYNIEKNENFLKAMEPNKYCWFIMAVLCIIAAIGKDLNYENLFLVSWGFCLYYACYCVTWCLHGIVHAIIKKVCEKKQSKEAVNNENK